MPFGQLTSTDRLGVANVSQQNATGFATAVLRLANTAPIYQGQLVHNTVNTQGPITSAEWCGAGDSDVGVSRIIRQISTHDTVFARRNISDSPNFNFDSYIVPYNNQLFYMSNEPEAFTSLSTGGVSGRCSCWEAPEWVVDNDVAGCFPTPTTQYWEIGGSIPDIPVNCPSNNVRRIRADALARVFLIMKRRAESRGQGHIVLPPASINAALGSGTSYWQTFYNTVASGLSGSGTCGQAGLPVAQLAALHAHYYNNKNPSDPLGEVAVGASLIRKGHDWYKNTYNAGNSLPLDYLLSECGPSWEIIKPNGIDPLFQGVAWSGGYSNMLQGLSYWNSWLCWITRRAPYEMNLQNWSTDAHVMYACIHQPDLPPYAISNRSSNGMRNQWYFNLDAWNTYTYYNAPMYLASNLASAGLQYQNSFSYFTPTTWNAKTWYLGPFGACYHVWSKVGADPTLSQYGTGWFNDGGVAGVVGGVNVTVPGGGWSTIYIPFIKNTGAFYNVSPPVQYTARWQKGDGSYRDQGYLDLSLFKDTTSYTVNGYTQTVYSSMVLPLVVYSSQPRTFRLELTRNINGPQVIVGRPVVLSGIACSWSTIN